MKNKHRAAIASAGGEWGVLTKAFSQSVIAIDKSKHDWPTRINAATISSVALNSDGSLGISGHATDVYRQRPIPFSVLWPLGSQGWETKLVMVDYIGVRVVMPLPEFKRIFIDGTSTAELPEADL